MFVAAGQSNMEGHGWPYQAEDIAADARIWDTNYTNGAPIPGYEIYGGTGVAGSVSGATTYRSGPLYGGLVSLKGTFMRAYADNYTGPCRIMITTCNWGGTGFFYNQSNCPSMTGNMTSRTWDRLGSCRATCMDRVGLVISNTAMNGNVTLRAILWHQGEMQINNMYFNNYTSNALQLIDDWRGANGPAQALPGANASTPFIVGGLNWGYIYGVHNGQRNAGVDIQLALAHLQDNRTNVGFASSVGIWYGSLHFAGPDLRTLGARYYNEFLRLTTSTNVSRTVASTPNCTGAPAVSGVPSGTRAFYPLDGRLDDCGPNALLPLSSDPGHNQTVRYGTGPYPRNFTSLHLSMNAAGYAPMIVFDSQLVDRVYPTFLVGSSTDLMPIGNAYETSAWATNTQAMTASVWVYHVDGYNTLAPLVANGFLVFTRGRPALEGNAASMAGVGGCAYNYDPAIIFPVRRWAHVVYTSFNSTFSMYVDGALVKSYKDCFEPLDMRNVPFSIGRIQVNGPGGMPAGDAEAYFQWFRVYDRLLSASEVAALYNAERVVGETPGPFVSRQASTFRYTFDLSNPLADANGVLPLTLRDGIGFATAVVFQIKLAAASNVTRVATPNPPGAGAINGQAMEQYLIGDSRVTNLLLPEPMLQWSVCLGVYFPVNSVSACTTFGLEFDARPDARQATCYAPTFTACGNNSWTYADNTTIAWTGNGSNLTGVWHHLCVTMNYANRSSFTVYYNGAARGTGTRGNMTARPALLGLPLDARLTMDNVWMTDSVASAGDILAEYLYATVSSTVPTQFPTMLPTPGPGQPTLAPSAAPSTAAPTAVPSRAPSSAPTASPTRVPSIGPTAAPTTSAPTGTPTAAPSLDPTGTYMCYAHAAWCTAAIHHVVDVGRSDPLGGVPMRSDVHHPRQCRAAADREPRWLLEL